MESSPPQAAITNSITIPNNNPFDETTDWICTRSPSFPTLEQKYTRNYPIVPAFVGIRLPCSGLGSPTLRGWPPIDTWRRLAGRLVKGEPHHDATCERARGRHGVDHRVDGVQAWTGLLDRSTQPRLGLPDGHRRYIPGRGISGHRGTGGVIESAAASQPKQSKP